jgi:hypothetical protein
MAHAIDSRKLRTLAMLWWQAMPFNEIGEAGPLSHLVTVHSPNGLLALLHFLIYCGMNGTFTIFYTMALKVFLFSVFF